jgi:hypothetical protein
VLDRKTSERVHLGIGRQYLNTRIIPAVCAKAGVPTSDVRGNITSHRARSTIASLLVHCRIQPCRIRLRAAEAPCPAGGGSLVLKWGR